MRQTLCFGLATATKLLAYAWLKEVDYRGIGSTLCDRISDNPTVESDLSRDAFDSTEVPKVSLTKGHTHPNAAAARNLGIRLAGSMALRMGVGLFVVQMSKADQRKGYRGNRQWYWPKDTNVDNRRDGTKPEDLMYICDTDYYIDMPAFLATHNKPVLLYTAVPSAATTKDQDSSTYFDEYGRLVTLVAGGGRYEHHLWNYAFDSITVRKTFLGIPYKLVTYAVERKQVSDHRQIILLAPIKVFRGFAAWLGIWLFEGNALKRFDPIEKTPCGLTFVRFKVHTAESTLITTARPSTHLSCTVDADLDDAVATVARLGTTNLMLPTVASWLGKDQRAASAVLTEYHRRAVGKKMPTVFPVKQGVRAYQYDLATYDQEARPKLEAFMSPLVHEAFAPVTNVASEEQCVKGRINDLKKPEPGPCEFRDQCLREFIDLVSEGLVLEPVDYETVAAKQTTSAQKLSLMKAVLSGTHVKNVLKCFIKAEAYQGIKDPRNISTYNDSDKLSLSTFSYSLSQAMKKFKWYAPGMTPLEVAIRVAEICHSSEFVNVSDYKRMDGTVSYWLRLVDRGVLMKTFVNHRAVLNELLKRNCDNKGYLPLGTTFDQGSSHGSGCPFTSLSQTLRSVFCAYLAFRHTKKPNGMYYTPTEAFKSLGIHSGDDGLDGNLPVESHEWAANKVGLILEANTVNRGHAGVNFLARYYSTEVWEGRLDSMCDVKRQLAKFHTTVRLPKNVLAEHKLVEKCMGYVSTDGNTPVVGSFCKRVLMLSQYRPKTPFGITSWWSRFDKSVQFPNSNADGWMDVEFERQFPEFDRLQYDDWMASTRTATQMLEAPVCAEPSRPKPGGADAVVDDSDIVVCEDNVSTTTKSTSPSTKARERSSRRSKTPDRNRAPRGLKGTYVKQEKQSRKQPGQKSKVSTEKVNS